MRKSPALPAHRIVTRYSLSGQKKHVLRQRDARIRGRSWKYENLPAAKTKNCSKSAYRNFNLFGTNRANKPGVETGCCETNLASRQIAWKNRQNFAAIRCLAAITNFVKRSKQLQQFTKLGCQRCSQGCVPRRQTFFCESVILNGCNQFQGGN